MTVAWKPDLTTNTYHFIYKEHPHVQILKLEKVYPLRQQKNIEVVEARPEVVQEANEGARRSDSSSTLRHVAIRSVRRVPCGVARHRQCCVVGVEVERSRDGGRNDMDAKQGILTGRTRRSVIGIYLFDLIA